MRTLIYGAFTSGKTTFADTLRAKGFMVLDTDEIYAKLFGNNAIVGSIVPDNVDQSKIRTTIIISKALEGYFDIVVTGYPDYFHEFDYSFVRCADCMIRELTRMYGDKVTLDAIACKIIEESTPKDVNTFDTYTNPRAKITYALPDGTYISDILQGEVVSGKDFANRLSVRPMIKEKPLEVVESAEVMKEIT